jgi:hypothetical protein
MFFTFPENARWDAERQAVEFGVGIGEYQGVVRVPRRVFQRLLPERPTPERCVQAYYLQRTRFESIAERKLRRRQLTEGRNHWPGLTRASCTGGSKATIVAVRVHPCRASMFTPGVQGSAGIRGQGTLCRPVLMTRRFRLAPMRHLDRLSRLQSSPTAPARPPEFRRQNR